MPPASHGWSDGRAMVVPESRIGESRSGKGMRVRVVGKGVKQDHFIATFHSDTLIRPAPILHQTTQGVTALLGTVKPSRGGTPNSTA